jgi:predicted alpha/beta hydrolase family esterase
MRTSEVEILIVPGWSGSGPDHWQSRWERSLKTARRIEQQHWREPDRDAWVSRIVAAVADARLPPVLVAHSLGVIAAAHAGAKLPRGLVAGAFLVAPADIDNAAQWPLTAGEMLQPQKSGFSPVPMQPLPFAALMIASASDPYCTRDRAKGMADAWRAAFVDAGDVGHINTASGHGPWPDGLLRFGSFLQSLPP